MSDPCSVRIDDRVSVSESVISVEEVPLSDPLQLAGAKQESNQDPLDRPEAPPTDFVDPACKANDVLPGSLYPLSKASAFAQLVQQGWEAYINDASAEAFPLQLLCGSSESYGRLLNDPNPYVAEKSPQSDGHLLAPAALRHTHSSPLKYGSSAIFETENEQEGVPPPIPLDPFQRSSSTPCSFRQRSTNSAFTARIPSQRVSYTSIIGKPASRASAFDPVKYYTQALEDMERTSIEVSETHPMEHIEHAVEEETMSRLRAANRAAKFLSDVRVMHRRRRAWGGRDFPATPASEPASSALIPSMSTIDEVPRSIDTTVTVITEADTPDPSSILSQNSLLDVLSHCSETNVFGSFHISSALQSSHAGHSMESESYKTLNSNVVDEEIHFQRNFEVSEISGIGQSSSYLPMIDERVPSTESTLHAKPRTQLPENKSFDSSSCAASTPSPTRMNRERSNDSSNASPGTRSSATGSSSGHTTQETISTLNSEHQSAGLSTISETDREVMQANSEGKRRRRTLDSLRSLQKLELEGPEVDSVNSSSSSSRSSDPSGYIALSNSPIPLREGANVAADRFFTNSPSTGKVINSVPIQTTIPLRRCGQPSSPVTIEVASHLTLLYPNNENSANPPKFVSCMDREKPSDLTSFREVVDLSSKRVNKNQTEEREDSPAEFVTYPGLILTESELNRGSVSPFPRPTIAKGQRYRATRPPRTPTRGLLPVTEESLSGTLLGQHSDGANPIARCDPIAVIGSLVGSSSSSSSSNYLVNKAVTSFSPVNYDVDEFLNHRLGGITLRGRTCEDGSVEVLKASSPVLSTGSALSSSTIVTLDKNGSE